MNSSIKNDVYQAIHKTCNLYEKRPDLFTKNDQFYEVSSDGRLKLGLYSHIMHNMGFYLIGGSLNNQVIFAHDNYKMMPHYKAVDMFQIFVMAGIIEDMHKIEKAYMKNIHNGMTMLSHLSEELSCDQQN